MVFCTVMTWLIKSCLLSYLPTVVDIVLLYFSTLKSIHIMLHRFGMVSYSFNQEIFSVLAKGLVADSTGIQDKSTVCGLTDTNRLEIRSYVVSG